MKDRVHRCEKHEPGSNACYTICRCRCYPCSVEATEYRRQLEKEHARGESRKVDAEPVREHVRSLMASRKGGTDGVGLKQIAKVSGVSHGSLYRLIYGKGDRGPSSWVRRETAERVLAVTHADMADGATVPGASTWKRLSQMLDAGFARVELARLITGNRDARALQVSRRRVTVGNARRVAQLHRMWVDGDLEPHGPCSRHHDHDPAEVHADVL